jgi:hypothetical protein
VLVKDLIAELQGLDPNLDISFPLHTLDGSTRYARLQESASGHLVLCGYLAPLIVTPSRERGIHLDMTQEMRATVKDKGPR